MIYSLTGLRKEYAGRAVLDIPSLEIRNGEILSLVGPSGAGKSTFLRLLGFLERPTAGVIRFAGTDLSKESMLAARRQVTLVFQRPLLQRSSVRANVAYGLRLRGLPLDGHVDEILREVGLESLAHRPALSLSGGEMQRVALARALVIQPRVLLLDEPTANLDPYNVELIENLIRGYNATRESTVVLVTHNVFQARRLAHRTGLLLGGRLVELQDTPQFFLNPADPRTGSFVRGEMAC